MSRGPLAVAALLIPHGSACGLLLDLDSPGQDGGESPRRDAGGFDASAADGGVMDGGLTVDRAGPVVDGGPCVPTAERCNGLDDDCNGEVDEDFDFSTDPIHCGGCDVGCGPGGTCRAGACEGGPLCGRFDDWGCSSMTTSDCMGMCGAVDVWCTGSTCGCGAVGCLSPAAGVMGCERCRAAFLSGCCP